MKLLDRILRTFLGRTTTRPRRRFLATEIDRVRAALRRHEAKVEAMNRAWARARAPCCPNCMFGDEYTQAAEKCDRTRFWLNHLLRKQGRPEEGE